MPAPITPPDGPPGDRHNQGAGSASPEAKPSAHEEPSVADILAEASAIYPDTSPSGPTAAQIAAEAYAIYLHRGARHGEDVDHWLEAERILRARWTAARATGSTPTASPQAQESPRGAAPLAGSGQVQRREDPQAPKDVDPVGLEGGRGEDAERPAGGGVKKERSSAKVDQPLRSTKNGKDV